MTKLGIYDVVLKVFDVVGWSHLVDLNVPTYYELVYEFLANFELNDYDAIDVNTPGVVNFQLLGKNHSM